MSAAAEEAPATRRSIRILWISHFPVFGGPHNIPLRLAPVLRDAGIETTVLLPHEPGTAAERLRAGGVSVVTIPLRRLRRTRDLRIHAELLVRAGADVAAIRRVIRDGRHDVVMLTGLTNPHGALAARLERVPLVWQILDTATPPAVRRAVMPFVRRWADAVMFNGEALETLHCGLRPLTQPTTLFTGPVDTQRFRPATERERGAMRAELGVPAHAPFVGTVANLNPMKGIEWFVRAAVKIHAACPEAWFLISGAAYGNHAGYLESLRREMRESPVPAERWIVRHDAPDRHYPALDVKLITSLPASEGRTTTGPEAMSCGVPVVAVDVGAVREVIEDGVTGSVVPPRDADALARSTLRLLADRDLRMRLGAAGRRRAEERYALAPSAQVYVDLLACLDTRGNRTLRRA